MLLPPKFDRINWYGCNSLASCSILWFNFAFFFGEKIIDISEAELSAEISVHFLFCVPTLTASYPLSIRPNCGESGAGVLWIGVLCLAFGAFGALGVHGGVDFTKGCPGCDSGVGNEGVVESPEHLELEPG